MADRSNIEAVARAITAKLSDDPTWIDRHWHCAAAELEAGLIDDDGKPLPGWSLDRALEACADWRRRNPES